MSADEVFHVFEDEEGYDVGPSYCYSCKEDLLEETIDELPYTWQEIHDSFVQVCGGCTGTCMECGEEYFMEEYHPCFEGCYSENALPDTVNSPPHYTQGKIEVLDAIEDWDLEMHEGNVVKYLARAKHKHPGLKGRIEDLKKAQVYLTRKIKLLEERLANETTS